MTGRGVDQILPQPGDPRLWETYASDARAYVRLAEAASGTIPRPVGYSWPWGEALDVLAGAAPDARVINLETSITRSDDVAVGKDVHYRMSPDNVPGLSIARPDVCTIANNHVLDFGPQGLRDTIEALTSAGVATAGGGRDLAEAGRPARVPGRAGGVVVVAAGTPSSGVPMAWAATPARAGVYLVAGPTMAEADALIDLVSAAKQPGDVAVASIHWGSNWGYAVEPRQVAVAHRLIDGGVDIVHGHSSHHARPIEVYRGRLVLYGCGDFIDDYEGIRGYEEFRGDLRLMYFATVDTGTGALVELRIVPMQAHRMRLRHASTADSNELRATLDRVSDGFGTRFDCTPDGVLSLRAAG